MAIWLILAKCFSTGDICDFYQYCVPFAKQHSFLDIRFPLIGNFPPFSNDWGTQWPFHMAIKSLVFSIFPYSPTGIRLFSLLIVIAGSALISRIALQLSAGILISILAGIVSLTDIMLLNHSLNGRPEVLTCLLLLVLVNQARTTSSSERQHLGAGYLIPFILLPGTHHLGLMIAGGLLAIHVIFFRTLYPRGSKWLRFGPLLAYLTGISLLVSWFVMRPSAWEQMKINLLVQDAIYDSATRFTYFLNFLPGPPFLFGYALYVPALALGLLIAFKFLRDFRRSNRDSAIQADLLFAGAIVVSLPVLGFIFRVDNYFHFAIGSYSAIYLLLRNDGILRLSISDRFGKVVLAVLLGYLSMAGSAYTGWKAFQFYRMGFPNLEKERIAIVEKYQHAGRIYIPTDLSNEGLEVCPDKCQYYTFPLPLIPEMRQRYELGVLKDAKPGDIIIAHSDPLEISLRLLKRPIESFTPPPADDWEFVGREVRSLPGRSSAWGWDFSVYRRK